jgi:hypothetical protein
LTSNSFGPNSKYFTRKVDGLFFLAARNHGSEWFQVFGDYGTDGGGQSKTKTFYYNGYVGFNLRIWGTSAPSINELIILKHTPGIEKTVELST